MILFVMTNSVNVIIVLGSTVIIIGVRLEGKLNYN
jgi:hypothetical protein